MTSIKNTELKNETKAPENLQRKTMKRLWHIEIKQTDISGTELRFLKKFDSLS